MIGAIIGDICGSTYEFNSVKSKDFPLITKKSFYTDDTVLTIAVADAITNHKSFVKTIKEYAKKYPNIGYGSYFRAWVDSKSLEPYNSFGNGSAMRVSSIGFYYDSMEEVLEMAKQSAEVTHNHIEGIKGAQAVALAIYLARTNYTKEQIKQEIENKFDYNLSRSLSDIEKNYYFNATCQGSVPEAIIAFLESTDYESAIKNAIWLKGDADTQACIAGGIAEAYYKKIPDYLIDKAFAILPREFLKILYLLNSNLKSIKCKNQNFEISQNIFKEEFENLKLFFGFKK